jgi:hypothetical protein
MSHYRQTIQPCQIRHDAKQVRLSSTRRSLTDYTISDHARIRAAQRNLSLDDLQYVLCYGRVYYVADSLTFFLGWRDIRKEDRSNPMISRLEGTAIITAARRPVIITAWRNRNGMKKIRRKLH